MENHPPTVPGPLALVGPGRLGTALAAALGVATPFGRDFDGHGYATVVLCVPDAQIAAAARAIAPRDGLVVGHCSGATGLDVLAPHEAFGLHPLLSVPRGGATFAGAGCAVAGSSPRALATARALADHLAMHAVEIEDADRPAYHAAASMASNYLVTLEVAAERLLATTGAGRDVLVPLVRGTVESWAARGADALTGPIARGDEETVRRQREAVAERAPGHVALFDAMAEATRDLAARAPLTSPTPVSGARPTPTGTGAAR